MAGVRKQYVNLPRKATFATDGIKEYQCGPIRMTAKLEKSDPPVKWKVTYEDGDGNTTYSQAERGRNPNFKMRLKRSGLSTGKVTELGELMLPAAGANRYTFILQDEKGKEIGRTKPVEAWRRLYYQVISMQWVDVPSSMATFEDAFRNEADKFFLDLQEKEDGRKKMKFIKTVNTTRNHSNHTEFRNAARRAYKLQKFEPYSVAVVFSNYIASQETLTIEHDLSIPGRLRRWRDRDVEVSLIKKIGRRKQKMYLWHALEPRSDAAQGWLVSEPVLTFDDGSVVRVPKKNVRYTGSKYGAFGGYSKLEVDLDLPKLRKLRTRSGKLKIRVRVARGYSGGFSYNVLNLITVATKAWWDRNDVPKMFQILNHEMGHKVGMVADGVGRSPDKPPFLYGENRGVNDKGHQGPHCEKGANYSEAKKLWSGRPACVMFGSTGVYDRATKSYHATPDTFCPDCGKVVRKLDLDGSNLPGLKNRF